MILHIYEIHFTETNLVHPSRRSDCLSQQWQGKGGRGKMTSSPLSLISIAFLDKLGRLEDKKCWNSKLWNQLNDLSAKLGPSASWSNRYFCWTPARRRVESHQKIIWSRTRNPLKARSPLPPSAGTAAARERNWITGTLNFTWRTLRTLRTPLK